MNKPLKFNVFHPDCPSRIFFEKFADKWILLIVYTLDQDAQHFNQLKKSVTGISPKVLSQKLKILERDGMLTRTIHDDNVIRIEYALTELGKAFAKTADQLKGWVEENMDSVLQARSEFDQKH
ncbi:transcriptional regulator, HxlR family [Acinetobacter marinus]|uniref:Transcriptional regulator, HxlR family n=1 Tax=Acinetobacter marinus TaxID=281375 RepID=A0A1G6IWF0_9GAMM|nr:helix-turn-helix domain-containing protein [Acinetobacter marinus]SDC10750.1 transcriptional regulator, HxlR family [Acinetobacter marinus]